jgi:hypothetical protein
LVKHFNLSPNDAWNCTLREYLNFIECDKKENDVDFEGADMSKEALETFVAIHEENRAKKAVKEVHS